MFLVLFNLFPIFLSFLFPLFVFLLSAKLTAGWAVKRAVFLSNIIVCVDSAQLLLDITLASFALVTRGWNLVACRHLHPILQCNPGHVAPGVREHPRVLGGVVELIIEHPDLRKDYKDYNTWSPGHTPCAWKAAQ